MNRLASLLALLLALALVACSGTPRDVTARTLNALAAASEQGGAMILDAQCSAELRAIGHTGGRFEGRCTRTDAPREATEAERAELARVRAQWAEVIRAWGTWADAHATARGLLRANDSAAAGKLPGALARLAEAYGALRSAAAGVGVELPPLPGIEAPPGDAGND